MQKLFLILLIIFVFSATPAFAKIPQPAVSSARAVWPMATPDGYTPISWAKAPGIATFFKAPSGNGSIDFLTRIYLPQNQIQFIASSSSPLDWGLARAATSTFHNFAFARIMAETAKATMPAAKFIWNAPFFNITIPTTDLSLALKSTVGTTTLITSGSRPAADMAKERRMLIINNQTANATVADFDESAFVSVASGDQAVEGFAPTVTKIDSANAATGRLFLGVSSVNSKELVVYCSQQATVQEASDALAAAGIPPERQLEADGGGSATCGYNLPGQFFVEPTRMLPLLMGAVTIVARGAATVNGLNVRSGPSTKYSVVTKLPKGAAVKVLEEKNGWFRIGDGQWVLKTLIKKT